MKTFIACLFFLFSLSTFSETETERVKILVRIEQQNGELRIFRSTNGDVIPGAFANKDLADELKNLEEGDEVLMEGHINYRPTFSMERTSFKPYFMIESIRPVSLKRLGQINLKLPESSLQLDQVPGEFRPLTLPVSTEVASALTMTTTLLLMDSLTSGPGDPSGRQDLRRGLIISAGTMATVLFIYEQMKGK